MLDQSPLLRSIAKWLLVAVAFIGVAMVADVLGDAISAVVSTTAFGF